MTLLVDWTLGIPTVSELNKRDHWAIAGKRHKVQKWLVANHWNKVKPIIPMPVIVRLTRIARRSLDVHDNLPGSLKYVADALAELLLPDLKQPDSSPLIKWEYAQETGPLRKVRIQIYSETSSGSSFSG